MIFTPFTAALLPPLLLLFYIFKKDPQPEPTRWLVKGVLYGIGICIPVALLESAIQAALFGEGPTTLLGTTFEAFLVAALPEESFKLLVLWLLLRHNPYFDEHFDGIVYAVCVSLGFAAVENVIYILSTEEWQTVAIARALLAVPGHYVFAVLMGYYYSIYHFVDHSPSTARKVLLVPVLAHGIYDSLALSGLISEVIGGLAAIALIFFCIKMHKIAYKKIMEQIKRDKVDSELTQEHIENL